jgi:hypothetical protein
MGTENPSNPRPEDIPEDQRTRDEPDPSDIPPKTPQRRSNPALAAAAARASVIEPFDRAFK